MKKLFLCIVVLASTLQAAHRPMTPPRNAFNNLVYTFPTPPKKSSQDMFSEKNSRTEARQKISQKNPRSEDHDGNEGIKRRREEP